MAWEINFAESIEAVLGKLDHTEDKRIRKFLYERVANLENPRSIGAALKGKRFEGLWKYRVGAYRVICRIEDEKISILVLKVGNRDKVYK